MTDLVEIRRYKKKSGGKTNTREEESRRKKSAVEWRKGEMRRR